MAASKGVRRAGTRCDGGAGSPLPVLRLLGRLPSLRGLLCCACCAGLARRPSLRGLLCCAWVNLFQDVILFYSIHIQRRRVVRPVTETSSSVRVKCAYAILVPPAMQSTRSHELEPTLMRELASTMSRRHDLT